MAIRQKQRFFGVLFSIVCLGFFAIPVLATTEVDSNLNKNLTELKSASEQFDTQTSKAKLDAAGVAVVKDLPPDVFLHGRIISLEKDVTKDVGDAGTNVHFRTYTARITGGSEKGKEVQIEDNDLDTVLKDAKLAPGDQIAIVKTTDVEGKATYHIADRYRVPAIWWMIAAFLAATIFFGGWRGFTSIFGLAMTVLIIVAWAVPRVMSGGPAFVTMLIATFAAALFSLYLAHGFNRRTTIAVASTLLTLVISVVVELLFVNGAQLTGLGSESAYFLQGGGFAEIDLKGLLLGGILIGVLGILDDVTTAQVAVIEELKAANPNLGFRELYRRGISVGREHIASLTNTLFLAYAGASLPLFMLFSAHNSQPLWFIANGQVIAEEVTRTLVGSICLILAVPISTLIAARHFATRTVHSAEVSPHHH